MRQGKLNGCQVVRALRAAPWVVLLMVGVAIGSLSCTPEDSGSRLSADQFEALLEGLAVSWSTQDLERALDCFTKTATYMQPPDKQLYRGESELRVLFEGLSSGTTMRFHQIAFDGKSQRGFGEFTFGHVDSDVASHGVAVIEVTEGRISSWREYFESGPSSFLRFVARDGKNWEWTARQLLEAANEPTAPSE